LRANPNVALPMYPTVMTNPTRLAGYVMYSPGGSRWALGKIMERGAFPLNAKSVERCFTLIVTGTPQQKMSYLEQLLTYLRIFHTEPENEQIRPVANAFLDMVRRSRNDPVPGVAAWGAYLTMTLTGGDDRMAMLQHMSKSDYWPRRMLSLVDVRWVRNDDERAIVDALLKDPNSNVRKYAEAVIAASKEGGVRPPAPEDDMLAPGAKPETIPGGATVPQTPLVPPKVPESTTTTQPVASP
jgi:hypothetical protein